MPPLQIHSSKNEAATTWVENAWARLMNVVPPEEHNVINNVQQRWREYYADVGGAFIHARAGYNTNYLDAFIAARLRKVNRLRPRACTLKSARSSRHRWPTTWCN
jgi:hypothetical protein